MQQFAKWEPVEKNQDDMLLEIADDFYVDNDYQAKFHDYILKTFKTLEGMYIYVELEVIRENVNRRVNKGGIV